MRQSRTPKFIRELDQVRGVGRKTRAELLKAFPSEEKLKAASEEELARVIRLKATAARVRLFLDGNTSQDVMGKKHISVWNTLTKKVVSGFFAPTEDALADFLRASPHFEVRAARSKRTLC